MAAKKTKKRATRIKPSAKRTTRKAQSSSKSKTESNQKADLFSQLVALSGLPASAIKRELKGILEENNLELDHLTLEQLRTVVASYLRKIMGGLLHKAQPNKH